MSSYVHSSAIIESTAELGDGCKIWHFVHVSDRATIGAGVTIGQNGFVGIGVVIGDRCKIQNNVSIFEGVTLEDDVFCGPSVVFTNVINPRAFITQKGSYSKTRVKKGATIGANATIRCGINIGEFAFVGAGSVVTKNIKPFALVVGNPAKQIGWVNETGTKIPLSVAGSGIYECSETGHVYELKDSNLIRLKPE